MTAKFCNKCKRVTCFDGHISFCQYCGNNLAGAPELPKDPKERLPAELNLLAGKPYPAAGKNGQLSLFQH